MKLLTLVVFLACAAAAVAAESPPTGKSMSAAGFAFRPRSDDYYPAVSRNVKEEGLTKLKFCYDDRGMPVQVTVDKSSGFTRLDEAALRYGKAVRIKPGLNNGQPQPGCISLPVQFSLKKIQEPPDQRENLLLPDVQAPPVLTDIPPPTPLYPGRFIPLGGETG